MSVSLAPADLGQGLAALYGDNHLLVVDKPAGLAAVPDESGDPSALELARAHVERVFQKPGAAFLGVVHRLDRPVSGVLLFARTSKAAARLSAAWQGGAVQKTYAAVVPRWDGPEVGEVRHHLTKDERQNRVRVSPRASPGAKEALTRFAVLARGPAGVLLRLEPVTGRSHQLRAACAASGAPILGDLKYGAAAALPDGQIALHALSLALAHPVGGAAFCFRAAPRRAVFAPWLSFLP